MNETFEDKKRERNRYSILVSADIKSMNFKTNAHIDYLKFVFGTIFIGAFFMWSSSNKDSNFFRLLNENEVFKYVVAFTPYILIIIFYFFLIKSAKARRAKIDITFFQEYTFQKIIFADYIIKKLGYDNRELDYQEIIKHYEQSEDIEIEYYEFQKFVTSYFEKRYKLDYPELFFSHFTWLILYNEDTNGTLVRVDEVRYVFIIKNNIDFIIHVLR